MSQKEVKRAQILDLLIEGKISQQEASKRLGVTTRQVRRLTRRYQAAGLAGLVSKKRGRASNRRLDEFDGLLSWSIKRLSQKGRLFKALEGDLLLPITLLDQLSGKRHQDT
jgi:transposase